MRRILPVILFLGLGLAAQSAPPSNPPATAPAPTLREVAAIPASKLATLQQLANLMVDPATLRQNVLAGAKANEPALTAALKKQGLSDERAQAYLAAFEQQLAERVSAAVNQDFLIQLLDASYTDEDATQLLAFYKTPLGSKVAHAEPEILGTYSAALERTLSVLGKEVSSDVGGSFPELHADTKPTPAGELPRPTEVQTLYPPVAQAPADLAAAEKRAAANGHRVLVIFGGNWCYDCHVLDAALDSPAYAPLAAKFERVNVNVGDTGQDNLDLAQKLGVDVSKGVPSLAVLDATGKVLVAQRQGEFEDARTLQGSALTEFLKTWAQP